MLNDGAWYGYWLRWAGLIILILKSAWIRSAWNFTHNSFKCNFPLMSAKSTKPTIQDRFIETKYTQLSCWVESVPTVSVKSLFEVFKKNDHAVDEKVKCENMWVGN